MLPPPIDQPRDRICQAWLGPSQCSEAYGMALTWPAIRGDGRRPLHSNSSSSSLSLDGRLEANEASDMWRSSRNQPRRDSLLRKWPFSEMRLTHVGSISGLPNNTLEIAALISRSITRTRPRLLSGQRPSFLLKFPILTWPPRIDA